MTIAEQIYQEFKTLPENMQAEVLDYVKYLKYKSNRLAQQAEIDVSQLSEEQRKLYEIMTETANRGTAFAGVDVLAWQKAQRQDKTLAFREE